jgi:putative ABC transport system permease protein
MRDTYHDDQADWLSNNYASFVLVRPGVTKALYRNNVMMLYQQISRKATGAILTMDANDSEKIAVIIFIYPVMPLTDIHLHSNKSYEFEVNGNITYVYIFLHHCHFHFADRVCEFHEPVNRPRSANRAKEVGIRKVAGSSRGDLITQFLTESVLTSFFSLLLAIGIAALLLPLFNQLAESK